MSGVPAQVLYFGKLPSRGDFVRSASGSALIHSIDQWISQALELLAEESRWKIIYDASAPIHFAMLGAQSEVGLVGYMVASQDGSGRRFPFVVAASFAVENATAFIPYSPQALSPLWGRLETPAHHAVHEQNFASAQDQLNTLSLEVETDIDQLRGTFREFALLTTVEAFEAAVSCPGAPISLRQTALALGLLLQPVLSQGHTDLSKGLVLPLPRDSMQLPDVLTLWVDMVVRFFKRTDAEISLLVTTHNEQPILVIGFHGASPTTLRSCFDPEACRADNVVVAEAEWVEDWIGEDYGMRRFSNYLLDPSLSLAAAIDMFRETFLGE